MVCVSYIYCNGNIYFVSDIRVFITGCVVAVKVDQNCTACMGNCFWILLQKRIKMASTIDFISVWIKKCSDSQASRASFTDVSVNSAVNLITVSSML